MGNIIVWLAILGAFGWMAFNYFRIRKAAKFVDNATFEELIRQGVSCQAYFRSTQHSFYSVEVESCSLAQR